MSVLQQTTILTLAAPSLASLVPAPPIGSLARHDTSHRRGYGRIIGEIAVTLFICPCSTDIENTGLGILGHFAVVIEIAEFADGQTVNSSRLAGRNRPRWIAIIGAITDSGVCHQTISLAAVLLTIFVTISRSQ